MRYLALLLICGALPAQTVTGPRTYKGAQDFTTATVSGVVSSPCTTTALSLQFNSAGSFGCVPDLTWATHTATLGASGIMDFSAGTLKVPSALAGSGLSLAGGTVLSFDSSVLTGVYATIAGPNVFTAGGLNSFTSSATTPGARFVPAANPSTPSAGGWNYDLGGTMQYYNGTAWQTIPTFVTNAKTGTYQVLAADFAQCKTIPVASGTFTITLVASGSQPADGQCIRILNYGSGVVTVARSGQNINGGTSSITIPAGSASAPKGLLVTSNATDYFAQTLGAGSGDVVGPGSATDNAVARFDGTTGKLVQNSGVTIDDSGNYVSSGYIITNGDVLIPGGANFTWASSSRFSDGAVNGNIKLSNNAVTDFGLLQLGGGTSAFPALKRVGNAVALRLADDTIPAFSALTACASGLEGAVVPVSDSSTATWGATITGSGSNHVLAYCNGTNWTVAAK